MTTTSDEIPVPAALTSTVQRWQEQGSPAQPPVRWSLAAWRKHFPNQHAFLDALPERIDRTEATRHAAHAATPEGAEQAFLTAMIWGYGRVGYGPWRTARVLTENPHAVDRLAEVALVAREHGGLAAFRDLADKPLRYLGVAFGTKYLRFVTAAQSADSAPILDAVVRRWLSTHTGLRLMIDEWRPAVYEKYVALLGSWSAQLGLTADTVEELIFRSAVSREGSGQWSEPWASSPEPPDSAEAQAQAALLDLERLFDTADPGPAREARPHLDELERIIRQGWTS
ncbi:8-oxoguanine DNA glycosylase OGG fold protein [Amycolatopsis sp. NPDC054798]